MKAPTANPEKSIKGYHVYRMDERNDTAQIPRLTAEPIAAMTYRDPTADRLTRRYPVVARWALSGKRDFPPRRRGLSASGRNSIGRSQANGINRRRSNDA